MEVKNMPRKNKYFFINKENFRIQSKQLQAKIEEMYNTYYSFHDQLKGLRGEGFVNVTALELRAGITDKMLDKLTASIEEYRRIFFEMGTEILQTSIEDFMNKNPK